MLTVQKVDRLTRQHAEILTIPADASIVHAAEMMRRHNVGCLLVLDAGGNLDGLLTERDIISQVVATGENPFNVRVGKVMTRKVLTCSPDMSADEAQQIMAANAIRHLPIVENGKPVGMVSSRDILAQQVSAMRIEIQQHTRILDQLENEHPGISRLQTDNSGRVVI
ncbi:MAG: CBS domain-containing protein [Planctomycetaceae bacterium]|nr:MAG: CBS domain-containing protein [Planctomycetaceae bacterium]